MKTFVLLVSSDRKKGGKLEKYSIDHKMVAGILSQKSNSTQTRISLPKKKYFTPNQSRNGSDLTTIFNTVKW